MRTASTRRASGFDESRAARSASSKTGVSAGTFASVRFARRSPSPSPRKIPGEPRASSMAAQISASSFCAPMVTAIIGAISSPASRRSSSRSPLSRDELTIAVRSHTSAPSARRAGGRSPAGRPSHPSGRQAHPDACVRVAEPRSDSTPPGGPPARGRPTTGPQRRASATSGRRACRPSSAQSAAARVAGRSALAASRSRGTTADLPASGRGAAPPSPATRRRGGGRPRPTLRCRRPPGAASGTAAHPSAFTRQIRPRSRPLLRSRWLLSDGGMDHGCSMVSRYMSQI